MTPPARLLILDDGFDLSEIDSQTNLEYTAVVALFWLEPTTRERLARATSSKCYGLPEIIGSEMSWGREAHARAERFIIQGPYYEGLPWRTYLLERLYREAFHPCLMDSLCQWAERLRLEEGHSAMILETAIDPVRESWLESSLAELPALSLERTPLASNGGNQPRRSRNLLSRLARRVARVRLVGGMRREIVEILEALDKKFRWRLSLGRLGSRPELRPGSTVFFSSYENNSRILGSLVEDMPSPVTWVLTNRSAGAGAPLGTPNRHWLWNFAPPGHSVPAPVDMTGPPIAAGEWPYRGQTWHDWRTVEASLLANLTVCWERLLDESRPGLVVVANQWGIEGWIALLARRRGVPVLQASHGLLGGHLYTRTPVQSDLMLIRGEVWRGLWPSPEQPKILAYNPPGLVSSCRHQRPKSRTRQVTFFSWPIERLSFYNASELRNGFASVFRRLLSTTNFRLLIRPHPLENPGDMLGHWSRRYGPVSEQMIIDKGEPLEKVLAETDVALMFRSTVMLDCLANRIPVILPDWIDFGWNETLRHVSGVYAAPNFLALEERLVEWIEKPPSLKQRDITQLVKPSGEGSQALRTRIEDWITDKPAKTRSAVR